MVQPMTTDSLSKMGLSPKLEKLAREAREDVDESWAGEGDPKQQSALAEIAPIPLLPPEFTYEIGEGADRVKYRLRKPVLKQQNQFFEFLRDSDIHLPFTVELETIQKLVRDEEALKKWIEDKAESLLSLDINMILTFLGEGIPRVLAILLRRDGEPLKEKNLAEVQAHLEEHLGLDEEAEIVTDFFALRGVLAAQTKTRMEKKRLKAERMAIGGSRS